MANVTEHFIPQDQLDLLRAYIGTTHDMLSFDATFRASAYHDAFLGMRCLILPDQHVQGSAPFQGDSTVIETDWHQRDSDDHHTFVISRHVFNAQPTASDWVRPCRIGLGTKLLQIEVFSAQFTLEYLDGRADDVIVYDKFIRFISGDGAALTLTTAHGSILGEIEVRAGHMFTALGEGPDSAPQQRIVLR